MSKKLEDNAKNILKSSHCRAAVICRAMEYSNVIIKFKILFMFCHLEQKCLYSRNYVWKKHNFWLEKKNAQKQFRPFHYHINFIVSASLAIIT